MASFSQLLECSTPNLISFLNKTKKLGTHVPLYDAFLNNEREGSFVIIGKVQSCYENQKINCMKICLQEVLPDTSLGELFGFFLFDEFAIAALNSSLSTNCYVAFVGAILENCTLHTLPNGYQNYQAVAGKAATPHARIYFMKNKEPEEKSVAKPLQKMSYQYTTISNIIEPIKEVHVYGVIKTIEKAPTATKNLKMMSRVILVDDSIDATQMFFRLHIFYNRHDEPPKIERNHILRVHRMQVEKFNNGVDGRVFRTTDLLTFSPNPDDHDNFFSTANTFELTDRDLVRVQELRTWLKTQEWFTGQTNAEISPLQTELRHISAPIKFNLICKIVNVSLSKNSECIVLTVADGTECPSKLIKVDNAQNLMLHDILNSSNFQENLIEVDVIVLNPTEEFKLLKEGQFVQLQNTKSKEVPNKFSSDEVLMILVLDTNGGSFLNYQPHHSKAKEINRKLDDISKNMEDSVDERLTRLAKGKHVYSFDNSYSFISNGEEELNEQLMSPNKAKNINPMLKTNEQLSHELSPHTSKSNDSFIHSSPQTSKSNALVIHSSPRASKSWGSPSTSISSTSKLKGINTTAKQTCQHSPISNSKIISPLSKKVDIQIDKSSPLGPTKSIHLLDNSNHENIGSPPSPSVATLEPIDKSAFKKRLNMDLDLPGNMPIYAKQDAIISSPQSKSTAANKRSTVSQIDNTNDRGILLKISLTGLNSKNVIEKAEPIKSIKNVDQNPFEIEEEQDNLIKGLLTFNSHPHYILKNTGVYPDKPKHLLSNKQLVLPGNNSSEIEHIICLNNTASQINQPPGKNLDNQIVCVEGLNKAYIDDINKKTGVMKPGTAEGTILTPDSTYSQFVGHIDLFKTSTQKPNSSHIPQTSSQLETKRSHAISCEKNILPKTGVQMPKCPYVRNMNDCLQRSDECLSVGSDVDLVMDTDEENKLTKNNVWGGNLLKKPLKSIHKDTILASALTTSLSKRKRDRTRYKVTESGKKDSSSDGEEVEASKRASLDLQLCSDINLQGSSQGMKDLSSTFISTSCVAYNKELNAVSVSYLHSSKSPLTTSSNTQPHSPHNERLEDVIISDQQMINSEMSLTSNVHSHLSHNERLEVDPTIVQLAKSSSVTTFTNAQPHSLHNERLENVSTSSQKVTGLSATVSSNAHSHLIDNKSLENDPIFVQQTMGSPRTTSSNTQPHSPNNNILENLPTSAQQGRSSLVVGSSNAHLLLPHHERPVDLPICDSENLEEIPLCDKQMTELPATTSNVLCVAHDKENEIISLADRQESPIPLFNSVESEQNIEQEPTQPHHNHTCCFTQMNMIYLELSGWITGLANFSGLALDLVRGVCTSCKGSQPYSLIKYKISTIGQAYCVNCESNIPLELKFQFKLNFIDKFKQQSQIRVTANTGIQLLGCDLSYFLQNENYRSIVNRYLKKIIISNAGERNKSNKVKFIVTSDCIKKIFTLVKVVQKPV